VRRRARHINSVNEDLATAWLLEAGDHAQRCRLAAPRRPEQGEEFTARDGDIDAVNGDDTPELLAQSHQLDCALGHGQAESAATNRAKLLTKSAASASLCCAESSHCSAFPQGGRNTPPLCWNSQWQWL
jgi:hypothetical protein